MRQKTCFDNISNYPSPIETKTRTFSLYILHSYCIKTQTEVYKVHCFRKMLDIDSDDLNASIESFMKNYTAIDLLNYGLQNQSLMKEFLVKNDVKTISSKLPGIIVQVYLLIAQKFNFNVFGPLTGEVSETLVDDVTVNQDYNTEQESIEEVLLEEIQVKAEETGKVSKFSCSRLKVSFDFKFIIMMRAHLTALCKSNKVNLNPSKNRKKDT